MSKRLINVIYRIRNKVNGKSYIGQAAVFENRKKQHLDMLTSNAHHSKKLQNAFNKYGTDKFKFTVVESGLDPDVMDERETYWIAYYDSFNNGYNMVEFGDSCRKAARWNDIDYGSHAEAAAANGYAQNTMTEMLKAGYTCDADKPGRGRSKGSKVSNTGYRYICKRSREQIYIAQLFKVIDGKSVRIYYKYGQNLIDLVLELNKAIIDNGWDKLYGKKLNVVDGYTDAYGYPLSPGLAAAD